MSMQDFSDNLSTLSYEPRNRCPTWIYNKKDKSFFGRTCWSWAMIALYYCIFYAVLAGFFLGMMNIFLQFIIPEKYPLRTGQQSLLRFSPGLGYSPIIGDRMTSISFSPRDPQIYYRYVDNLNALISYYENINEKPDSSFAVCDNATKTPNDPHRVCRFNLTQLGPCSKANDFGYAEGKPCILVKVNRVYGWMPDVSYNSTPHVLVTCEGQNPEDKVNIGNLSYYPGVSVNGTKYGIFNNQFFPFLGQHGYTSPLVAVKFESVVKNILVAVQCKLLGASNVETDPIKFEILVD